MLGNASCILLVLTRDTLKTFFSFKTKAKILVLVFHEPLIVVLALARGECTKFRLSIVLRLFRGETQTDTKQETQIYE